MMLLLLLLPLREPGPIQCRCQPEVEGDFGTSKSAICPQIVASPLPQSTPPVIASNPKKLPHRILDVAVTE